MNKKIAVVTALLCCHVAHARADTLFYMENKPDSVRSFIDHADQIGFVSPAWYNVRPTGEPEGKPDARVLGVARAKSIQVMPIVSITAMSGARIKDFHQLVNDPKALATLADRLVTLAKDNHYVGFQFDFEGFPASDRDAYTLMTAKVAESLHRNGLKLSVAVIPNAPLPDIETDPPAKWGWSLFAGGYDLKGLAAAVDFVSFMTYDQHGIFSTPGPVAGYPWVQHEMAYATSIVAPGKLYMGIPTYGYEWAPAAPVIEPQRIIPSITARYLYFPDGAAVLRKTGTILTWDDREKEAFGWYYVDNVRRWISLPDARSFAARMTLARSENVAGVAVWVLGSEDPAIWKQIPVRHR